MNGCWHDAALRKGASGGHDWAELEKRSSVRCSLARPVPLSSMACCLAARNHMTGRGPCSTTRSLICNRKYATLTARKIIESILELADSVEMTWGNRQIAESGYRGGRKSFYANMRRYRYLLLLKTN